MHVFDSGDWVFGCGAPGPLSALDTVRGIFSRGAFIILIVTVFILGVRYEEPDSAKVRPACICRAQAVTAGPKARGPWVIAPVIGPVTQLRTAKKQPVRGAGWGLAD